MRAEGRVNPSKLNAQQRTRIQLFGQRVRMLRLAKGWKPEELAERSGLDRETIRRIERAAVSARLDTALVLAETLGVTATWLLDGGSDEDLPVQRIQ